MKFTDLPAAPVPAFQSVVEFGALWDYAAALTRPHVIVEVGSLYGGTLWYWLHMPSVRHVVSVDMVTDYAPYRDDVLAARAQWHGWTAGKVSQLLALEGDSHDPAMVEHYREMVGAPIDVLFLDGDHTYEGVSADFDLWAQLVRPGGLVAFHDTVVNGTRNEPGVRQLVNELKWRWRLLSVEFFDPDGAGITAFVL